MSLLVLYQCTRRLETLQRAESEFDPVPFDAEAARIYGRVTAAVIAAGRKPRGRAVDLMIAATAIAERLPLYTTSPADFTGLDSLLELIAVARQSPAKSQPTISAHKTEFPGTEAARRHLGAGGRRGCGWTAARWEQAAPRPRASRGDAGSWPG
jgi:hypothetical protein